MEISEGLLALTAAGAGVAGAIGKTLIDLVTRKDQTSEKWRVEIIAFAEAQVKRYDKLEEEYFVYRTEAHRVANTFNESVLQLALIRNDLMNFLRDHPEFQKEFSDHELKP